MKLKLKKYPKKPKASASVSTKERYLERVKEIDRHNADKIREQKRSKDLDKKISGLTNIVKGRFDTTVHYSRKRARKKPNVSKSGRRRKSARKKRR